jgi:hypothetical protein
MILVALFLFVPLLLAVSRLDAIAAVPLALRPVMQGFQLLGGHFATAVTSFVFVLLLPDVTVRRVVHMFPVWKTNIASPFVNEQHWTKANKQHEQVQLVKHNNMRLLSEEDRNVRLLSNEPSERFSEQAALTV